MFNRFSWRGGATVLLGVLAVVLFRLEVSRRRRQGLQSAGTTEEARQARRIELTGPAAITPAVTRRPVPANPDRASRRRVRASGAHRARRSLPRTVVFAAIAAFAAPAVATFVTIGGGSSLAPSPALAAEAIDTENGVYVLVQGEGFEPGSTVQLYWHHQDDDTVETTASASGAISALAPLPGSHHPVETDASGMTELIANDGTEEVRLPVAITPQGGGGGEGQGAAAVDNSRINVNGSPYFLLGANYPWLNYGNDFGQNAWGSYGAHANGDLAGDFADMKARGVHVVRWWVFADGRAGINFAADGTPTGVQPVVYEDLSRAIEVARQNNIYLNLVLFDVSLLGVGEQVNGVQVGGHSDLVTNTAKRNALMNNVINPLVTAYRDEPSVLSWEIMNEPEWALSDIPQPAVNPDYVPVSMQQFWAFASSASAIIHFQTPQQVTIGSAALKWNKVWTDSFAANRGLPEINLDFYQTHYYQWMDCCSTNAPELGATSWSPLVQRVSDLQLDKPIVVGEIHTSGGSTAQTLDAILANGYAGVWSWSYNSQATGDHLSIDWGRYSPWEAAHAADVRIPPSPASPPPATAVPATKVPPTATRTQVATATSTPGASALAAITLGRATTVGTFDHTILPDFVAGSSAVLARAGTLSSLSVFVAESSPGARIRLGIYTADDANNPDRLVAQTNSVAAAPGWNTVPVTAAATVAPGNYWLTMQTDDQETAWRLAGGVASSQMIGFSPSTFGQMPESIDGWMKGSRWSFAQYATVMVASEGGAPEPEPTVDVVDTEPTIGIPGNEPIHTMTPTRTATATRTSTAVPVNTSTPTRTPTPPAVATSTPTRTATPAGGATATPTIGGGCVSNCGEPRFFCDTWTEGGFCDDYRIKGSGNTKVAFPAPGDSYSFDAFGSTQTGYNTSGQTASGGLRGFSTNEHFMTVIDDETFGMGVLRVQRPFDFANREGHVHFEIDLKTSSRRYVRFMLSPQLTKSATDDRMPEARRPRDAFDLWFLNGTFVGQVVRNGSVVDSFNIDWPRYYGQENVRDDVDVYITRTSVRLEVNGTTFVDESIADLGFDRAYMYLVQASYNPCKDGECSELEQTFHWDNVAFDGPTLGKNSLTPAGQRDVVFNAFSALTCTVRGVPATASSLITWGRWVTWSARLPDDGSSVSVDDVVCVYDFTQNGSDNPRGFEIVKR